MLPDVSASVKHIHASLKEVKGILSLRRHTSAVRELQVLYASLRAGASLSQGDKTTLLSTGLRLHRRAQSHCGEQEEGTSSCAPRGTPAATTSAALLFATIAQCLHSENDEAGAGDSEYQDQIAIWLSKPMIQSAAFESDGEQIQEGRGDASEAAQVVMACLRLTNRLCTQHASEVSTELPQPFLTELMRLSDTHFQAALQCVIAKSLRFCHRPEAPCYASLQIAGLSPAIYAAEERSSRLAAIAASADSEAGQAILRDLLASFLLPRSVVGTRPTLCFDRDTARRASLSCPEVVARAHEVATGGALEAWQQEQEGVVRSSALLAGFALILRRIKGQSGGGGRKTGDAFGGRVELEFLTERVAIDPDVTRLRVFPEEGLWVLHSLTDKGLPAVCYQGAGFEGLCNAILLLQDSLRRAQTPHAR
jgi:hypothetical protein